MTVLKRGLGVDLELFDGPAFRFIRAQKHSFRRVPVKVGLEITFMGILMKTVNQGIDGSSLFISRAYGWK
tara:strand:- start:640 stop:849 length:210 start_codon:yes stop_codon:yes gene_type:complete